MILAFLRPSSTQGFGTWYRPSFAWGLSSDVSLKLIVGRCVARSLRPSLRQKFHRRFLTENLTGGEAEALGAQYQTTAFLTSINISSSPAYQILLNRLTGNSTENINTHASVGGFAPSGLIFYRIPLEIFLRTATVRDKPIPKTGAKYFRMGLSFGGFF